MKNKNAEPKDGQDRHHDADKPAPEEKKPAAGQEPEGEGEDRHEEENGFEVRLPTMKW